MYYPVSSLLIEAVILAVVNKQDSYGYEISQTIKKITKIKESTLYPILKKLQASGYLTSYSVEYGGRQRKYYKITESGIRQSDYLTDEWHLYSNAVSEILSGKINTLNEDVRNERGHI